MQEQPRSTYLETPPPPALASVCVCFWSQVVEAGAQPYPQEVLPDGCTDLIWFGDSPPLVTGPATRATTALLPPGSVLTGVRIRPGLVPRLLGVRAWELLDQDTPLAAMWGDAWAAEAFESVAGRDLRDRHPAVARLLARRVERTAPGDGLVEAAVAQLARQPTVEIQTLSWQLGVSPRQLQRRITEAVGYAPKTLQRVLRLQRALHLAATSQAPRGLAQLAAEAGYADQAHMTREMQRLARAAPSALVRRPGSALGMSDLFKASAVPRP